VRRRWVERPLPNLRRLFKANRKEAADGMEWLPLDGLDSPAAMIAGAVVIALLVLILLPLLGVALELIALLLLIVSGLFGRVVLRRPWVVTAEKLGSPEERVAFAVQGWRDSSQALRELRTTIAAAGPPERLSHGEALATRPAA
jgi:hypothetical protein